MKFGICNEMFKGWKWERAFEFAANSGYDGIEIAPFTFADSVTWISGRERENISKTAGQNNLDIIGLHWLLASPEGMCLSSPNSGVRDKTIDYLKELVNFCADLGGKLMIFGSPKQRNVQPSSTYEEAWKFVKEGFIKVLPLAEKRNVTIAMEPLARSETNFINTAAEAVKMIDEINHPNFKLHLDVKAMSDEQKDIADIIRESKNYLVHFHANDANLLGPGFGEIDYHPIKKALEEIGYNGYLSVEVFDFTPGPEVIAEKSIRYLKNIFT